MKRNAYTFRILIEQNKEEIKKDFREIEKIEKKLDSKYMGAKTIVS